MPFKYQVKNVVLQGDVALISATPLRKTLHFTPGQYASLAFMRDGRPSPMRCFSIVGEKDGSLSFAARITGDFTAALSQLQPGDELRVRGPFGNFYIDTAYDKKVVMLASGIGITPFLSMLRQGYQMPTTLLYSNRDATAIPFYDELCSYARQNSNFQLGFFSSENVENKSNVIPGRITERHIQRVTGNDYAGATYFICGPGNFSQRMHSMLMEQGVPGDRIITESFTQTTKDAYDMHAGLRRLTYRLSAAMLVIMGLGIMTLDLSRAVPKLVSQQSKVASTHSAPATTPSANTGSSTDNSSSTSSSTNNSPSTTPTTPDTTPTQSTPTQQTYYQPPTSSVS